jgi:hypothetical protein
MPLACLELHLNCTGDQQAESEHLAGNTSKFTIHNSAFNIVTMKRKINAKGPFHCHAELELGVPRETVSKLCRSLLHIGYSHTARSAPSADAIEKRLAPQCGNLHTGVERR